MDRDNKLQQKRPHGGNKLADYNAKENGLPTTTKWSAKYGRDYKLQQDYKV